MRPNLCLAILACALAFQAPARAADKRAFVPEDHYAQVEQIMEGTTADLLALRESGPAPDEPYI